MLSPLNVDYISTKCTAGVFNCINIFTPIKNLQMSNYLKYVKSMLYTAISNRSQVHG